MRIMVNGSPSDKNSHLPVVRVSRSYGVGAIMEVFAGCVGGLPRGTSFPFHEAVACHGDSHFHLVHNLIRFVHQVTGFKLATGTSIGYLSGLIAAKQAPTVSDGRDVPGLPEKVLQASNGVDWASSSPRSSSRRKFSGYPSRTLSRLPCGQQAEDINPHHDSDHVVTSLAYSPVMVLRRLRW